MKTDQELRARIEAALERFDGLGLVRVLAGRQGPGLLIADVRALLSRTEQAEAERDTFITRTRHADDLAAKATIRAQNAEARVRELEEEIERCTAQEEMDDRLRDGCMDSLLAAEAALKERDAEIARLREAAQPFAYFVSPDPKWLDDGHVITQGSPLARKQLTVGDCRHVRSALSPQGGTGG